MKSSGMGNRAEADLGLNVIEITLDKMTMAKAPVVGIIINNYNYGRFLEGAIKSALNQYHVDTEVIVVDDGSSDHSREIIAAYQPQIKSVFKSNGGQGSAFNSGFNACQAGIVIFLDADDLLLPTAAETAAKLFDDPEVVKVHWNLWEVDETGNRTGHLHPDGPLAAGDLREIVFREGPTTQLGAPTSGNAWSRRFIERVFPVPEEVYRICADKYLLELAPFFGKLRTAPGPQSLYRVHRRNSQALTSIDERLRQELDYYDHYSAYLYEYCEAMGINVDMAAWKSNSWWHRQDSAMKDIHTLPNATSPFILIDEGAWGLGSIAGRKRMPFVEKNGQYWGPPAGDEEAIFELERQRKEGAALIVFVWSTFWWLDYFTGLKKHLSRNHPCVLANKNVIVFDLK
jgi:glycosyltransferase involved in cell wall biosynthesis